MLRIIFLGSQYRHTVWDAPDIITLDMSRIRITHTHFTAKAGLLPLLLCGISLSTSAQDFTEVVIDAGFQITHPIQTARLAAGQQSHILLAGRNADLEQRLAVYHIDSSKLGVPTRIASISPDSKKIAFDIARFPNKDALVFIEPGRIVRYDIQSGEYQPIAEISSLYGQERVGGIVPIDFFRDLNGDDLDDLIVTDVSGYRVRLQMPDGSLGPESILQKSVRMSVSDNSVSFVNRSLVSGDMNFDGLKDLAVWSGANLQIYLQEVGGTFAASAIEHDTGLEVLTEIEIQTLEDDRGAVDQEGLTESRIYSIEDLDGDAIPDILTESTYSEGLFDRRNEFRLHLGHKGQDLVSYRPEPDALIASEGILFDPISTDIDGDGRMDLLTRKARFSFGRIIRALISGGMNLELQFYKMTQNATYPDEANYSTNTRVRFSRTSGQVDIPAFEVADFDGDGIQDMLLQSDVDELGFYRGVPGDELFAELAAVVNVKLPRNGELADSIDVNGDGRIDLIMRYSVADSNELAESVRMIIYSGD